MTLLTSMQAMLAVSAPLSSEGVSDDADDSWTEDGPPSIDTPHLRAPSPETLQTAIVSIDADAITEYGEFEKYLRALAGASGGSTQFLENVVIPWAAGDPRNTPALIRQKWRGYKTSYVGWDHVQKIAAKAKAKELAAPIAATPFVLRDPASIEPRRWLYGRHYIRGYLSATVAPGGLGKSSLVLAEATAMASGKNLLGDMPAEKLRVWYWNGEDPREEIERRETAACVQHKVASEDMDGRLFINSGRDTEIVIARADHNGVKVAMPMVAALGRTIRENKIDLLIIDPFVASHAVPENDNGAINAVCRQWAMLAEETGCAIELVHHVRKGAAGQNEYTVDDARGAGALLAAARSVRVLNRMSKDEASKAGIANPRSFFRVDNGKANLAPPAESSTWREIVSVSLGNDRGAIRGDSVGVVMPWTWPDRSGAVTLDDVRTIQEAIAVGDWRSNVQSDAKWAGKVVADVLDLDLADPAAKASAKTILKALIDDGSLKLVGCRDDTRKLRTFVKVGKKVNELRESKDAALEAGEFPENEVSEW